MHKNVETLIGRLATDPVLLRRFAENPRQVLAEFMALGLELTAIEIDALLSIDLEALRAFAGSLDRRLRKAIDGRPAAASIQPVHQGEGVER